MRKAMQCNAITGTGQGGEGSWAFPLPLARHHLVTPSATYRAPFQTSALTTPLMVWTVEGHLTVCSISFKNGVGRTGVYM